MSLGAGEESVLRNGSPLQPGRAKRKGGLQGAGPRLLSDRGSGQRGQGLGLGGALQGRSGSARYSQKLSHGRRMEGGEQHVPGGQQWGSRSRGQHPLLPHAATYSSLWISWQGYGAAELAHRSSASVSWPICFGAGVPFPTAALGGEERASSLCLPSTSQRSLLLGFSWHHTGEVAEGLCPSRSCQVEQNRRLSSALWESTAL